MAVSRDGGEKLSASKDVAELEAKSIQRFCSFMGILHIVEVVGDADGNRTVLIENRNLEAHTAEIL